MPSKSRNTTTKTVKLAPVHPGDLDMSRNQLAQALRVPANRISTIVAGERAITGETALRLALLWRHAVVLDRDAGAVRSGDGTRPLRGRDSGASVPDARGLGDQLILGRAVRVFHRHHRNRAQGHNRWNTSAISCRTNRGTRRELARYLLDHQTLGRPTLFAARVACAASGSPSRDTQSHERMKYSEHKNIV